MFKKPPQADVPDQGTFQKKFNSRPVVPTIYRNQALW